MTKRLDPEACLQRAVVAWLSLCVPPPPEGPIWNAINPVPAKSQRAAGESKALGLRAGWPDFDMVWRGRYIGLELKAPGKYPAPVQREVHQAITLAGGVVTVVRSLDDLRGLFGTLGIPSRERAVSEAGARG